MTFKIHSWFHIYIYFQSCSDRSRVGFGEFTIFWTWITPYLISHLQTPPILNSFSSFQIGGVCKCDVLSLIRWRGLDEVNMRNGQHFILTSQCFEKLFFWSLKPNKCEKVRLWNLFYTENINGARRVKSGMCLLSLLRFIGPGWAILMPTCSSWYHLA